jgi:hypothetical protein
MQKSIQQDRPLQSDTAILAYLIWEEKGKPDGCDVECWLEAERRLLRPESKPRPRSAIKAPRSP